MKHATMRMERVRITNKKDIDVCIRDAYGHDHILFPRMEKELVVITEDKRRKANGSK